MSARYNEGVPRCAWVRVLERYDVRCLGKQRSVEASEDESAERAGVITHVQHCACLGWSSTCLLLAGLVVTSDALCCVWSRHSVT